ncbi:GNAT family N-acetyltransferase [Streptomyces sp. NPDC054975]
MRQTEQPVFGLTNGLEVRPWCPDDATVLMNSCQDPDVQHWNRPGHLSLDDARDRIARWDRRWGTEEAAIWAIAQPEGGSPVGLIGLALW